MHFALRTLTSPTLLTTTSFKCTAIYSNFLVLRAVKLLRFTVAHWSVQFLSVALTHNAYQLYVVSHEVGVDIHTLVFSE
jgi:hypothetical protein